MKSSQREEIASKISSKITKMRNRRAGERTGKEALDALLDIEVPESEPAPPEEKKQVVLLMRNGLTGADSNWTKYPNEIHDVMAQQLEKEAESVLYVYLWRQSWGFGRNYCRTSYSKIMQNTVIRARNTARRSLAGLVDKKFVIKILNSDGVHDVNGNGGLYRILTPSEIGSGITEENVPLFDIPEDGVPMLGMPDKSMSTKDMDKKHSSKGHRNMVPSQDMPTQDMPQLSNALSGHTDMSSESMPREDIQKLGKDESVVPFAHAQRGHSQKEHLLKEESLKDTLSPRDIISKFYKSIGQSRVTKAKRERAEKIIKELQAEAFSLEDIHFASQWSVENAKEDLYDFSIVKHTIGQAMAAKEEHQAKETRRIEAERIAEQKRAEEEAEDRKREEIEEYKESLDSGARAKLRNRALREIKNTDGIKEDFINDMLIAVKENEILRSEME